MPRSTRRPVSPAAGSAPIVLEPRIWQGVVYRPCQSGASAVRQLFQFAGAFAPGPDPHDIAWEAQAGERLVGGVLCERLGANGFIHGPVVVDPPEAAEPIEVAAQLVAPLIDLARTLPLDSLFTRPQGLDRVWVRLGFVPMPEAFLPPGLRGRPGSGLHVWRRPGTYAVPIPDPGGEGRRRGRR
ncbi:MAG TPA: hypothetical protein VHF87_00190 [Methylomirabilota bacterium]|jgi:hypothetical protein|nr:hypothetical protein [Methylomirabilota bacterium]